MDKLITFHTGDLNPKQVAFCRSRAAFTAYGGARGGGKTHVLRIKAVLGALYYPGIRILIVRREYPELEQSIILPMKKMTRGFADYNGSARSLTFAGGSIIKFGHYGTGESGEYQGQEYDWIFLEEATQFTESEFRTLGACLRGTSPVPRRMYLTCNPGGVGHGWVKRLFVDKNYRPGEKEADHCFIPATVEDNPALLKGSPGYTAMLDLLPEDTRRAWRYGDWNALSGAFFPESAACIWKGELPKNVRFYRAFDYGLDAFAMLWLAVDERGSVYVYREVQAKDLIVSRAAELALAMTKEPIECTFAPPDMWSRVKESGRTMAELFAVNGLPLVKAPNERIHGWMAVKELMAGKLFIHESCRILSEHLAAIQHDGKNPSDCAVTPHHITHLPDALRYFAAARTKAPEREQEAWDYPELSQPDYCDFLTGGEAEGYLTYF